VAFNAICPHAGCTVAFASSNDIIACPCHGSEFNARTGAVELGPATRGLTRIPVTAANGSLYVDG
jgi:thiosulfate dehydrogenase [quinone] large subunit